MQIGLQKRFLRAVAAATTTAVPVAAPQAVTPSSTAKRAAVDEGDATQNGPRKDRRDDGQNGDDEALIVASPAAPGAVIDLTDDRAAAPAVVHAPCSECRGQRMACYRCEACVSVAGPVIDLTDGAPPSPVNREGRVLCFACFQNTHQFDADFVHVPECINGPLRLSQQEEMEQHLLQTLGAFTTRVTEVVHELQQSVLQQPFCPLPRLASLSEEAEAVLKGCERRTCLAVVLGDTGAGMCCICARAMGCLRVLRACLQGSHPR